MLQANLAFDYHVKGLHEGMGHFGTVINLAHHASNTMHLWIQMGGEVLHCQ